MKVKLYILLISGCFSTLAFSKAIDSNVKKSIQVGSSFAMGTMKYSQGHGEFTSSEGLVERKRSHKRRKAVRKPRRGRGQ
ncbi:hypothetical protein N9263_01175 [Candidatus Marinimicrobia bacterium]|nr:hypothetical protein [Candidatus Neomarinimicrobiota bacterium]